MRHKRIEEEEEEEDTFIYQLWAHEGHYLKHNICLTKTKIQ